MTSELSFGGISIPGFFLYALLALSAESMVFSGAGGLQPGVARRPKAGASAVEHAFCDLFLRLLCVCGSAFGTSRFWASQAHGGTLCVISLHRRPFVSGAAAAVRKISPSLWKKAGGALSSGALNTLVLSMPFLQEALSMDFLSSLGYALGTGAAFWLASVLLHSALQICSHKDVPRAYRGLPAALIYAGLICLAFCGFSGGRFF